MTIQKNGRLHVSRTHSLSQITPPRRCGVRRYPIQPPHFRFVTPVCHPNVHAATGEICLDVLKEEWSPAWTLHAAALAILVLLDNPDATSPLNCDAGNLLRSGDRRAYESLVRVCTSLYASASQ